MRKIKFRGKNEKGEYVFMELEEPIVFNGEQVESVAQFVGYDADGNEIYEGDEFFDIEDEEVTAKFSLVVTDDLDQFAGDIGDTFCNVKLLKENKK